MRIIHRPGRPKLRPHKQNVFDALQLVITARGRLATAGWALAYGACTAPAEEMWAAVDPKSSWDSWAMKLVESPPGEGWSSLLSSIGSSWACLNWPVPDSVTCRIVLRSRSPSVPKLLYPAKLPRL